MDEYDERAICTLKATLLQRWKDFIVLTSDFSTDLLLKRPIKRLKGDCVRRCIKAINTFD